MGLWLQLAMYQMYLSLLGVFGRGRSKKSGAFRSGRRKLPLQGWFSALCSLGCLFRKRRANPGAGKPPRGILCPMAATFRIYIAGTTLVHRADARAKLLLLLLFSIGVFFVGTWRGLGLYALAVAAAVAVARIPVGRLGALSLPLLVLLAFIWLCNAFSFNVQSLPESGLGGVSAGFMQGWRPIALAGTFGFVPQGCMFALFYAGRILLILYASFIVAFTTSAEALTGAFAALMRPLRALRVPVDDAATMLSLAVRFIPQTAEELALVRNAQASRGARFGVGSLWARIFMYRTVLIPVVVRLFRRADALGSSMDARCYGAMRRTSLNAQRMNARQTVVFLACSVALVAVAYLL